jgi:hypothetical protein
VLRHRLRKRGHSTFMNKYTVLLLSPPLLSPPANKLICRHVS